ncbi:Phosphoesterase RecJ-like protein [Macrophomina phaseolina MS6]|uniref:Phosphoesterase RecJ-like protein n=1 Tax=Macrophomina phaseolina (strain MS6) TaxID=1126212 RepID=K2S1H0_MACPH|nr:Phosphoesterase RecJ-like protein [Macrophomina phaseolina MS6]
MAAFPRNSIRSFLVHAKGALHTAITNHERVTLVIGNESADLDSLTCSLLYAYIRSQCPPQSAFTPLYIPVTNLPAADLQLRPEFLALLPHANLQPQHLITLDDLPPLDSIGQILPAENTKWILVDHNALQGILGKVYGGRVGGTIDHHEDEHKVPDDTGDEPRVITKSGSCSSLVTEYLRPTWDALSSAGLSSGAAHGQADGAANDAAQVKLWDAQAAQLVLASVLIDTSNLMSKEKTTEHDVAASGYLEAKVMLCDRTDPEFSKDKFYDEINRAKQDIGRLALNDILRKDYKQWNEGGVKLGISSVVKPLDFLQEKAKEGKHGNLSFCDALGEFAKQRGLEMYAIMTAFTTEAGEFRRQLLLWALSERAEAQARAFAESATTELELQELEGAYHVAGRDPGWKKVWRQGNTGASRKQVAPMLREKMR